MRIAIIILILAAALAAPAAAEQGVLVPIVDERGNVTYYMVQMDDTSAYIVTPGGDVKGWFQVPTSAYGSSAPARTPAWPQDSGTYGLPPLPELPGLPNYWE